MSKLEKKKVRDPIWSGKDERERQKVKVNQGYVAMLAVLPKYRGNGLGKILSKFI